MKHFKFRIGDNFDGGVVEAKDFEHAVIKIRKYVEKVLKTDPKSRKHITEVSLVSSPTI